VRVMTVHRAKGLEFRARTWRAAQSVDVDHAGSRLDPPLSRTRPGETAHQPLARHPPPVGNTLR
jgi:hypothetical protein